MKERVSYNIRRKAQLLFLFITFLGISQLQAQDSLATVYFYRASKFAGSFIGYDVKHEDNIIGRVKSGTILTYRCKPGTQLFSAKTESESSIKLILSAGEVYFIECSLAVGVLVGRPTFRQASNLQAKKDIAELDPAIAANIPTVMATTNQAADTIRALTNLSRNCHWNNF